jgi:hypothetical protein
VAHVSARLRYGLIAGIGVLVSALVVAWVFSAVERRKEEITLPAYGEPTYNPLYALRETLRRDGQKAESRRQLDLADMKLQPGDTVVMLDDPRLLSPPQVSGLLDWVQFGGHLVLQMPEADEELDGDDAGLLEQLGVETSEVPARCLPWRVNGQEEHQEFCSGNRFTVDGSTRVERRWGDGTDATLAWARLRYGTGRIDVLGSTDFLRNGRGEYETGLRAVADPAQAGLAGLAAAAARSAGVAVGAQPAFRRAAAVPARRPPLAAGARARLRRTPASLRQVTAAVRRGAPVLPGPPAPPRTGGRGLGWRRPGPGHRRSPAMAARPRAERAAGSPLAGRQRPA